MSATVDFDSTRRIQWEASDPDASAWVVANAGSGKTHVLTQRVTRLLLSGADPATILCLTFTKVAAAEMSRRIFGRLGEWATAPEAKLRAELHDLQGRPPTPKELRQARRLFARALETPGGLKIQTIHAFCERLLHQFPLEANVPGQFAILDDTMSAALLAEARAGILAAAAADPDSRLSRAIRYLAEHATDSQIGTALDAIIGARETLRRWMELSGEEGAGDIGDVLADLRTRLGLVPDETEEAICKQICRTAEWGRHECGKLTQALAEALAAAENKNDRSAHNALTMLATAESESAEAAFRITFFLIADEKTDGGWKPRSISHRFGAAFGKSQAGLIERFGSEAERLLRLAGRLVLARNFAATEALLIAGDAILERYGAAKRASGSLDFGDLIVKARNLLSRADAAAWVLYKLDARIEHILVDEAQDTSPDQWAIVRTLAADFFSGEGRARSPRTIFAVGDDKQSIFGFQGAEPRMLAEMERFFDRVIKAAQAPFVRRPLALSFRSTSEILEGVDKVFLSSLAEQVTASGYEAHAAKRLNEPGRIIVLPRKIRDKAEEPEDWTEPFDAPTAADTELAEEIADEVRKLIGGTLPSGKIVRPGEILILGRKRDAFVSAMNRALRQRSVPAAGSDRIPVSTHISVLDCLALADVMLLPEDDLQIAAVLKSPLIGMTEDELMELAIGREKRTLWSALRQANEPRLKAMAERLGAWRAMSDQVTPFRFFATVLGPDGGRRAFRERLGGEADDVLDAFLSQALAYEAIEPPSLQGFLAYLRASGGDIKREAEDGAAGVRVMTVHGAKGLEADIVFLVDTGGQIVVPGHRDCLVPIGGRDDPAFLWRRSGSDVLSLQRQADATADAETEAEYLRLLYVAMTRARDLLYVCGIKGQRSPDACWFRRIADALVPADAERDPETGELAARFEWPETARPPKAAEKQEPDAAQTQHDIPDWLFRPAPSPRPAPEPLRPSRALAEPDLSDGPPDPAAELETPTGELARLRGNLVHKLLQMLPDMPEADRSAAADRYLTREIPDDPALRAAIRGEAEKVLADRALAAIFGPGSRAEVALVGRLATERGEYAVSGQIDRLIRTADGWHIADFKSNRVVPDRVEEGAPAYILQLAIYRRLLMELEPGAKVTATLVWTAGPKIMPIPVETMESALAALGIPATAVP